MDVKTAARVLDVLNLFAEAQKPLLYSEIAAQIELKRDKSTRAIEINCWDIPFQGGISWDDL